jgi:UDP-2,3-diacylglucosamine pyrophosphatase LpxH
MYPEIQFHYVLGNHDSIKEFAAELQALQERSRNFEYCPSYKVIGDTLFLHGDLPVECMTDPSLKGGRLEREERDFHYIDSLPYTESQIEAMAKQKKTPLVLFGGAAFPEVRSMHNIDAVIINARKDGLFTDIKNICFGHTHPIIPIDGDLSNATGIRYYNTGSATVFNMPRMVHIDQDPCGASTKVSSTALKKLKKPGTLLQCLTDQMAVDAHLNTGEQVSAAVN